MEIWNETYFWKKVGIKIMDKYMSIGTVVELSKAEETLFMIIGIYVENKDGEKRDYVAVRYPMGAMDNSHYYFFNNTDIKDVVYEGYVNQDCLTYFDLIKAIKKREY